MKPIKLLLGLLPPLAAGALLINPTSASAALVNRYSFSGGFSDTNIVDSVGSADGTLLGGGYQGGDGQVYLSGGAYVDLPSGRVSSLENVTLECWLTVTPTTWDRIFDFGNTDGSVGGEGIFLTSSSGGGTPRFAASIQLPSYNLETPQLNGTEALSAGSEHYIVVVYGPNGARLFIDGVEVDSGDASYALSEFNDTNCWLGRSLYSADPAINGQYNEFRISDTPMTTQQIVSSMAGGPDNINSYDPGTVSAMSITGVQNNMIAGGSQELELSATFSGIGAQTLKGADATVTSDDTTIIEITQLNKLHALNAGTTTVHVTLGSITQDATITVELVPAVLAHRWSFNEANGSTTAGDSVGSADGTVFPPIGDVPAVTITNGYAMFPGGARETGGYIDLPDGIASSMTNITFEFWYTQRGYSQWSRVFTMGGGGKVLPTDGGNGDGYLTVSPNPNSGSTTRVEFNAPPGSSVGNTFLYSPNYPTGEKVHVVVTYAPQANYSAYYVNGVLQQTADARFPLSSLNDTNNWLGESQYGGDAPLNGDLDEFRMWEGSLSELQVVLDMAAGPDAIPPAPGALQSLSLTVPPVFYGDPVGSTASLKATFENISDVDVTTLTGTTLESTDTNVFQVDASGAVTPVAVGSADLIGSYGGMSVTSTVEVLAPTTLSIVAPDMLLYGNSANSNATLLANFPGVDDVDVTGFSDVTYESSDTNVFTVDASALLTPTGTGSADLIASYSGLSATSAVQVIAPTSIWVDAPQAQDAYGAPSVATLLADFGGSLTNVEITGFNNITRSSSNPDVVQINNGGNMDKFKPGSSSIGSVYEYVTSGGVTNQVTDSWVITLSLPGGWAKGTLIHRYSFDGGLGTTDVPDSVGTADGVVAGSAGYLNGSGQAQVPGGAANDFGAFGYIDLPNGLVSSLSSCTIEGWATPYDTGTWWQRFFDFGMSSVPDGSGGFQEVDASTVVVNPGRSYMFLSIRGGTGPRFAIKEGTGPETGVNSSTALVSSNAVHYAVVYDPPHGVARLFINGQYIGATATSLPLSVVDDKNVWLGRSQWGDPFFGGLFDEFRVYDGPITDAQIAADYAAGPDSLPVIVEEPTLAIRMEGGQVVISWPTSDTGFTLKRTAQLMPTGTVWEDAGSPTVNGGNYEVTVTPDGDGYYYRLEQ